jgi:hypothetical protein
MYTEEKFLDVSEKVLSKLSSSLARYIGTRIWKMEHDIRDVISIWKLVKKSDGPEDVDRIIKTMMKYGMDRK